MVKVVKRYTDETPHGEWLEDRTRGLGGSDVATVLGVNKYKSAFQLWMEKTGQTTDLEEETSEAAYWGNMLEQAVAEEFTRRTGKKVRRRRQLLQHDEFDFLLANIDRAVVGESAILECKTASAYLANDWKDDEIPPQYILQCQHYMSVTNTEKAYIAALIGGQRFVWKEIPRDNDLIEMMVDRCRDFWEINVLGLRSGGNPLAPAIDGSDAASEFLKKKFKDVETGKIIDLRAEHKTGIDELFLLKDQKKDIETRIAEIENNIKLDLENAETGFIGKYRVNWKDVTTNRVDTKELKKKYPEIAAEVTNASNSRRFEIKIIKGDK